MDFELNSVYYGDLREKKATARSAHNKYRAPKAPQFKNYGKRECKKLSGAVTTFSLKKPLTWDVFKSVYSDLRVEYIKRLVLDYGVGVKELSKMFGVKPAVLREELVELKLSVLAKAATQEASDTFKCDFVGQAKVVKKTRATKNGSGVASSKTSVNTKTVVRVIDLSAAVVGSDLVMA